MLNINNRRYIGNKTKIIPHILDCIPLKLLSSNFTFADIFAGTGVVAYYLAQQGMKVIINDLLFSNVVAYKTWFSEEVINEEKLQNIILEYNALDSNILEENYFSNIYGNKYYSVNDAKKIGFIREDIEKKKNILSTREYYCLLTSLMYFSDKIANTVGHFESFLKKEPINHIFNLELPNIQKIKHAVIYNNDANELVKSIQSDVVYVDPPYNARQYINFYHVLENLMTWEKPTVFEGNSMKFKRNHLKSGYSQSRAPVFFQELITNIKAKIIIVSYNNTYSARSNASNNKISMEQILDVLHKKGVVKSIEIPYKSFNAGKTDFKDHKEFLFVCEVK